MSDHELIMQLRGAVARGVVGAVDDTGDVQTVVANTGDGVTRSLVEVMQPYGFSSVPPDANPLTLVLSVGADQGHQVAMPLWSAYRFGNLKPGEVAFWDSGGNRLHFKGGGNIDLMLAALLQIAANMITVAAPEGVTFTGPVTFAGPVTFQGDVTIEGNLTVGGTISGKDISGKAL